MTDLSPVASAARTAVTVATPDYRALCREFVARAKDLDDKIMAGLLAASTTTQPGTQKGNLLGGAVVKMLGHHVQAVGITSRQMVWAAVAMLPGKALKEFADRRIGDNEEGYAETRAALLTHFFGEQVAQLLPEGLKTPDAAAYMQDRNRLTLARLIERAVG